MVELTGETLEKLQSTLLEMLIEIDGICREHDIAYSLDGGTLLGAIRHDGFIPWDDDADIVMTRAEYGKFFKACQAGALDTDRFFLQDYTTDPEYRWGYAKLRRNGTVFLRKGQEHVKMNQSVFMDIFIYDNVPDGWLARRMHLFTCFLIRKILYSEVGKKSEKNPVYRLIYRLLNVVPRDACFTRLEKMAAKTNKKKTQLIRHMTYPYGKCARTRYGLPRRCFDAYIDKDFAGHTFRIFKEYDLYLRDLYGDYMTLPPEEKRKAHPVSELKLLEEHP